MIPDWKAAAAQSTPSGYGTITQKEAITPSLGRRFHRTWQSQYMGKLARKLLARNAPRKAM
jgi:hypothetical protein